MSDDLDGSAERASGSDLDRVPQTRDTATQTKLCYCFLSVNSSLSMQLRAISNEYTADMDTEDLRTFCFNG